LVILVACGMAGAADPANPPNLNEALADYRALLLGSSGMPVSDLKVGLGHLQMTLKSGTVYPLVAKGGGVLGFLFEGQGLYGYTSEELEDRQIFPVNLSRNAKLLVPNQNTVWDDFEHALVFSAASLLDGLDHASGQPPSRSASDSFQRIWKRLAQTYVEYDHLAAEVRLNGGHGQYVFAEIEGKKETVGWKYDRIRGFYESLYSFRKIQGVDIRILQALSHQAISEEGAQANIVNLRDARFDIATSDNKTGTIVSDLTLESDRDGLRVFPLNLVNNRAEESYGWASTKNQLRVTRVTDASGNPVPFSHRYSEVLIQLPAPARRGESFKLHFETEGEIFTGMGGSRDNNYFELFTESWYPSPLRWDTSAFTFSLKVRTKKPWRPAASGDTVAFRETEDAFELETKSSVPCRDIAVFGGNYKSHEQTIDGITYRIHPYAMARKHVTEDLPKLASNILRFYKDHLGAYPYQELDIVEVPSYGFGIAPSGMVLMTTESFRPQLAWQLEYLSRGVPSVLAHEIAHQWFGHKAMPNAPEENWIAESMAEYMSGLAMGAMEVDERKMKGWKGLLAEWKGYSKDCASVGPLFAANMLGGVEGYRDRQCLLYYRGPLVLHMFRTSVGEQAFYATMRKFLDDAKQPVGTEDLKKACKATLRADMSWFWDEWIHKSGVPEVKVVQSVTNEGGKFVLAGRVEQAPDRFIKMIIPLVLDMPGGQRDVRVFVQEQPSQPFRFELAAAPSKVTVDPANNNLAVYR
jgi:hypothetical protein